MCVPGIKLKLQVTLPTDPSLWILKCLFKQNNQNKHLKQTNSCSEAKPDAAYPAAVVGPVCHLHKEEIGCSMFGILRVTSSQSQVCAGNCRAQSPLTSHGEEKAAVKF